jgi:hypothetical protein
MINKFQGGEVVYHSFNEAIDDPHNYYPQEFLNTLTPNAWDTSTRPEAKDRLPGYTA